MEEVLTSSMTCGIETEQLAAPTSVAIVRVVNGDSVAKLLFPTGRRMAEMR